MFHHCHSTLLIQAWNCVKVLKTRWLFLHHCEHIFPQQDLHCFVSTFLLFWKFDSYTIVVDVSKLFSLNIFLCKIYCCFSSSSGFQILFLRVSTFPLFLSLLLRFNCIIHSFVPPPSFFVPLTATSSPFTYLICSLRKSIFNRLRIILHSCRNSLTFHGYSLHKFFWHTNIFQLLSFPSRRYVNGF